MKTKKRLFTLFLIPALVAAASAVVVAFGAGTLPHAVVLGESDAHTHDGMTPWGDGSGQETSLPTAAGSYYLTKDITISNAWNVNSNISLCLNGHSITKTGSTNTVIRTNGSDAELNIYDCGTNLHYYYIDPTSHLGVVVDTLEEAQAGNPERNGSFNGGYITGGRGQMYDGDYRGGCAIVDNFSRFNLYGGTLIGNMADTSHKGGSFGTIWARFGDFAMHGGAIIGNYSRSTSVFSGNVNNGHGSFTMDGGLVADNTAEAGGTIYIGRLVGCSITGGVIRRNYNIAANASGSALYIGSRKSDADTETKVHIGGDVEITENRAEGFGGGLYLSPKDWDSVCGSVALSGSPKIYGNYAKQGGENYVPDNLYMATTNNPLFASGDSFFLEGALEEGTNIGVAIEGGTGAILQNWADFMNEANPSDYFHSDANGYVVSAENGQAVLGIVTYVVSFDGNSGTGSMVDAESGVEYTLPECSFTAPEGMRFIGWKWSEDGKIYLPGEEVSLSEDTSFIAQWVPTPLPDWETLNGIVYQADGLTPAVGAVVKLYKADEIIDLAKTDASGNYSFNCPDGFYNIIAEYNGYTNTILAEVSGVTVQNITLNDGKTESFLNAGDSGAVVGGLDEEAKAIRASEGVAADVNVSVTMDVEEKTAEQAEHADDILAVAPEMNLEFLQIDLKKTVGDVTTSLSSSEKVLEVIVPCAFTQKRDLSVLSYHDDEVVVYTESDTKAAGTFSVDKDNALLKIYVNEFSTFALGYTPYFNIGATMSLGSYTGVVTATLTNVATNEIVAKLENVALDQVSFQDLKKGEYLLTITWVDGAANSITMPITIG